MTALRLHQRLRAPADRHLYGVEYGFRGGCRHLVAHLAREVREKPGYGPTTTCFDEPSPHRVGLKGAVPSSSEGTFQ